MATTTTTPPTNPFTASVVEEFMNRTREAIDKSNPSAAAASTKKKSEKKDPPKLFNDEPDATAPLESAHDKWYSKVVPGGLDYLNETGLPDIDMSSIMFERSDWSEDDQEFIPSLDENYVIQHGTVYPAINALKNNLKVLVTGPTGSGKTAMYQWIAALCNQPYLRIGGRGDMESDTIFGKMVIKPDGSMQFEMADFPRAFRDGWLIALDEPWKLPSNITMAWQRVFERGGVLQLDDMPGNLKDKQIHADKRTRMVLCDNVVGTGDNADRFAATMIQDSSTLNRIDMVLEMPYLKPKKEEEMLCHRYAFLPEDKAHKAVQVANLIRDAYEKYQVGVTMSPRNLMSWIEMAYTVRSYEVGFKWVMLERYAEPAEREAVKGFYRTVFGTSL